MAETEVAPTFGAELKDGFKSANVWAAHGIAWLDDMQQFYRERSAVEKEYSARLNALAKRFYEKKTKKSAALSVGDSPAMTPGSLESASLTTWTTQLTTLEQRATEHDRYANDLVAKLAEPLKLLAARLDELRRRHADHADKLEKERDASYSDLRKAKAKYDAACQEVESKRKKSESAFDKAKAQSAYQQQILDMNNVKNTYIIAINVTNKQKEMYYHDYVPDLMDSLQDLSELRTAKLNGVWSLAAALEGDLMQSSHGMMVQLGNEIERNEPQLDTLMYMQHNAGTFNEPADKQFEPSPVWHDEDAMAVDDTAKVFLRNVLTKSKGQLGELRREVDRKRREVETARRDKRPPASREIKDKDKDKDKDKEKDKDRERDEVDLIRDVFAMQEELHQLERRRITAEIETSTITAAVGDVTLGAKNHNFKAQTFHIPTNCDLCGERIWGLSAKGFDCRDCGYTCHSKCEMKVPPECPGEQSKDQRKKLKAERQEAANALLKAPAGVPDHVSESTLSRSNTMNSLSSSRASRLTPATARASSSHSQLREEERPATPAAEEDEPEEEPEAAPTLPPPEVPAIAAPAPSKSPTPAAKPPITGAKKPRIVAPPPPSYFTGGVPGGGKPAEQKGKMLYGFEANGQGELSVPEGRDVVLLEPDDGSGWVKIRAGYKEGIVPSSYVELSAAPVAAPVPALPPAPAPAPAPVPAPVLQQQHTGSSIRPSSVYSNSGGSIGGASRRQGPPVAPKRGAKKLRYVEAVYEYNAQSETEHSMDVAERFVLIREDPGDGWVEVEKGGSTRSVPAAYVREV